MTLRLAASVRPELEVKPAAVGALTAAQRKQLADDYWHVYDREMAAGATSTNSLIYIALSTHSRAPNKATVCTS